MAVAEPLLHVRNLETYYGPIMAIRGVSFAVPRGAIIVTSSAAASREVQAMSTPASQSRSGRASEHQMAQLENWSVLSSRDRLEQVDYVFFTRIASH